MPALKSTFEKLLTVFNAKLLIGLDKALLLSNVAAAVRCTKKH